MYNSQTYHIMMQIEKNKKQKSEFKVHVQHITYGWCGIELLINGKLIKFNASYLGPNPLASLIDVCFAFYIARTSIGGDDKEEYSEKATVTWLDEPGALRLEFKLSKSDIVFIDIQSRDDDENILEQWHETIPYENFKDAIVAEGFRVLNAFGLYGYYVAWSDHKEFPLSQLLRLTGKLEPEWDGDNCSTNLSKELECLSNFINELEIKEVTRHDECKLFYESWQIQCCGEPFAVGDKVDWTCTMPTGFRNAHGIIIDFEEEHHGFATHSISGTVAQIIAERYECPKGKTTVGRPQEKIFHEEIHAANGFEKEMRDDENTERHFGGYIVTLKDAVVRPLYGKENHNQ